MRVISMQGPEVWEFLQKYGVYYADREKCRELQDYRRDIKQLGGYMPIWCWAYPELDFVSLYDNSTLEYLRCEMSLNQDNCWDPFVMLEIEIDENLLKVGIAYNGCVHSKVFGKLTMDMVQAVYKVNDKPGNHGWYYKVITPIWIREGVDVITRGVLDCYEIEQRAATSVDGLDLETAGNCLLCGAKTVYTFYGKHYCSLDHCWTHRRRFLQLATISSKNPKELLDEYNVSPEYELKGDNFSEMVDLLLDKANRRKEIMEYSETPLFPCLFRVCDYDSSLFNYRDRETGAIVPLSPVGMGNALDSNAVGVVAGYNNIPLTTFQATLRRAACYTLDGSLLEALDKTVLGIRYIGERSLTTSDKDIYVAVKRHNHVITPSMPKKDNFVPGHWNDIYVAAIVESLKQPIGRMTTYTVAVLSVGEFVPISTIQALNGRVLITHGREIPPCVAGATE